MTSRITIRDYDPLWPKRFETLRSRIAPVLGELVTSIEHVGSTSVPGLSGKPIIDIDVLLSSASDLPLVITQLASAGYEHQGNLGVTGREAFRPPPDDFPHHLYVCPPGSEECQRHLAFRDHLRTHPQDACTYAILKRELAGKFGDESEAYTQAKSEFVASILRRTGRDSTP